MNNQEAQTLKEYLYNNRLSVAQFARMIDYSRQHLYSVLSGALKPGDKLGRLVEKTTKGAVRKETLISRSVEMVEKNSEAD